MLAMVARKINIILRFVIPVTMSDRFRNSSKQNLIKFMNLLKIRIEDSPVKDFWSVEVYPKKCINYYPDFDIYHF